MVLRQLTIGSVWIAIIAIAGWAFLKMQDPRYVLEILQLFSLC